MIAKSNVEPIMRFEQGFSVHTSGVTRTNFAGDDSWKIRIHPRIDSISQSEGSVVGGQELTITGVSLNSTDSDISVLIDGVDCPVNYALCTSTSITCTTGAASEGSYVGNQPGSLGVQVK